MKLFRHVNCQPRLSSEMEHALGPSYCAWLVSLYKMAEVKSPGWGGGGVLHYMGYRGMCGIKGCGFSAVFGHK